MLRMNRIGIAIITLYGASLMLGGCDMLKGGEPELFSDQEIPLLPLDFPVYPTSIGSQTLKGLSESYALGGDVEDNGLGDRLDDILTSWLKSQKFTIDYGLGKETLSLWDALEMADDHPENLVSEVIGEMGGEIDGVFGPLSGFVKDSVAQLILGKLNFFDPGTLAVSVNQQIGQIFKDLITITEARVRVRLINNTTSLWPVPLRFTLYLGDGEGVRRKTAIVPNPDDPTVTAVLEPGEEVTIETDNIPALVTALNDLHSLAIDYDAEIAADDVNWSDVTDWFDTTTKDDDGNGVVDGLAGWNVTIKEFTIILSGDGNIFIPGLPDWMSPDSPAAEDGDDEGSTESEQAAR